MRYCLGFSVCRIFLENPATAIFSNGICVFVIIGIWAARYSLGFRVCRIFLENPATSSYRNGIYVFGIIDYTQQPWISHMNLLVGFTNGLLGATSKVGCKDLLVGFAIRTDM